MIVHDCEQGSDEWHAVRRGIPTASEFATVMARGRDGGESRTRRLYMLKLAGERLTGEPMTNYVSPDMERGKVMEAEARDFYAFTSSAELQLVGFITNDDGTAGCSPDALVGTDGVVEFKSAAPHVIIEKIDAGKFPAEHVAQCQGNLWITDREWIDIHLYWPSLRPFEKRAYRDKKYIDRLAGEVERFNEELDALVEKVRRYGEPATPLKAKLEQSVLMAG